MMSPTLFRRASKSWPLICLLRLATSSAFTISRKATNPSIAQDASLLNPFSQLNRELNRDQSLLPGVISQSTRRFSSSNDIHDNFVSRNVNGPSTSVDFAMDPDSEEARKITESLGISTDQHEKLTQLSQLVVEWNERLNLISRKDCNLEVVFGRHVLPSIALKGLSQFQELPASPKIVDVGTGGGFPGLPLSIVFPEADFLLVDSVGKKLKAIDDMASDLGLENITTHHGRAEEIANDPIIGRKHKRKYDICVGRSVTSMPKFCFWIQDLLKKDTGKLVYIIGGEVEDSVQTRLESDELIDNLLDCDGASDKRILVLSSSDVVSVARTSGEKKVVVKANNKSNKEKKKSRQSDEGKWNKSKGGWAKKDNAEQKDRGYSSFKRYEVN